MEIIPEWGHANGGNPTPPIRKRHLSFRFRSPETLERRSRASQLISEATLVKIIFTWPFNVAFSHRRWRSATSDRSLTFNGPPLPSSFPGFPPRRSVDDATRQSHRPEAVVLLPPPPRSWRAMRSRSVRFLSSQFLVFRPRFFLVFVVFCVSFTRVSTTRARRPPREITGRGLFIGKSVLPIAGTRFEAESVERSRSHSMWLVVDLLLRLNENLHLPLLSQPEIMNWIRRQFDVEYWLGNLSSSFAFVVHNCFYINVNRAIADISIKFLLSFS